MTDLQEFYKRALPNGEEAAIDKYVPLKEALSTSDATIVFPKTIRMIMTEAAEPLYLISNWLERVQINSGVSVEFVNFGAVRAHEIPEGSEYPNEELDMAQFGTGTTEVRVKKYGLKMKVTDEMINDSQWDVLGIRLRAAGRAMARKKEEVAFEQLRKHGHVVFDADDTNAELQPTGRGFDGTLNNTLSAEDFVAMCTSIIAAGFTPTDVVMHPLTWPLFSANTFISNIAGLAAFGGGATPVVHNPNAANAQQSMMKAGNQQLPVSGLTLSFSPWVPFNEVDKKFDVFILDRNNIGVLLEKESMTTDEFDDPYRDIRALKVKERYGIGILHGGRAIAVAKNIAYKKTYPLPERSFADLTRPADMTNDTMDKV